MNHVDVMTDGRAHRVARNEACKSLRIPVLTDEAYAPYRNRAKRCGVFIIARQMKRIGWPIESALQALAKARR